MGGDAPSSTHHKQQGSSIDIGVDDPLEAERIFNVLAETGTVTMSLQQTFWAIRFGMCTDRFGTPWMVNCEKHA